MISAQKILEETKEPPTYILFKEGKEDRPQPEVKKEHAKLISHIYHCKMLNHMLLIKSSY